MNIILIGMPGCGKTTIGKMLADDLKYQFCDLDIKIENEQKLAITQIFSEYGESRFRELENLALVDAMNKKDSIISTGGGIIKRTENVEIMRKFGIVVFIDRPIENIISDVDIKSRPLLLDSKNNLYKLFDERYDLYRNACDLHIINNESMDKVTKNIIDEVKFYENNGC
ncbi:MAG: shikimate kinase [Oscillospiraceae bacterium]